MKNYRRLLLFVSFFLLPVTLNFFSPVIIILGTLEGCITVSFMIYSLIMVSSIFLGRAYCSDLCPFGAAQEFLDYGINKPLKHSKVFKGIFRIMGYLWLLVIVIFFILNIQKLTFQPMYNTEQGASVDSVMALIRYYMIVTGVLIFPLFLGKRGGCYYFCPMNSTMRVGMKIGEWCHVKRLGIIKTEQACVNCHQCDRVCTMSLPVAQLVNHTPVGSMLADRECIQCGECVKKCPKKAIKWGKGKIGASVIVMGLILCTHPLQAEENETKEKQSVQSEQNIDRDYFDQLLLSQMKTSHAKAISFVLFTQDQIVMEQGYGTTDKGINVTEHTPMSIGSVTKVWTWAMLHRLINEGDLAINDKVVTYLPELNKVTHGDQITVEQLMTHTSGFEDNLSKLFTQVKNPKASLMKEEREVLFEPGTMIGYSNYGAALGGEIIERISSSTFEQCITEQFIKPLGLQDTSINHKLTRYYAAGAINASAQDMGKFGQMLLTQQEMEPMFEHGFSMVEDMPGMTYGMMEWERNGVRGVWHSGGTPTTYSMLFLIPEYQIGFFVAYERPDSTEERSQLRQAFLDYYFPVAAEVAIDTRKDVPSDEDLEGYYREARTSKRFPENLIFILARTEYLKQYPNGEIDFRGHTFRPIAPHHYIEVQGQQRLEIVWKDINGTGQLSPVIVQDEEPHEVYYPSGVYDTPPFVIGVAITVIVGVCVGGVILGLKLKRYLKKSKIN